MRRIGSSPNDVLFDKCSIILDLMQAVAVANLDDTQPSGRPTSVRWLIFALACGTSFFLYLHRYTWGFVKADVQEETGWTEWQLGWLDSTFSLMYGLGQIPTGMLCDWFGPHLLLGSMILTWSLATGAVAIVTSYTSMVASRAVFGLTQAGCYPTLSKVSKLWFPLAVRTSVQGWIATFFGRGGGAVSFFLVGYVLMGWLEFSWRASLGILTLIGVGWSLTFFLLFRNRPADHFWANEAETELVTEGNPEVAEATKSALRWRSLIESRNMKVFFVQQFTSAYADNVYVYWIPLFLLTAKGVDTKGAGWMAAVPLIGGAVGGMIGGTLQDLLIARTGNRRWCRSMFGFVGKGLATLFMFVSLGFDSAVVIVCVFGIVKFFSDWSQPTVWGTITDVAGRNAGSVFGAVNTVGSVAGTLAGPTMGLIIMAFSPQLLVTDETLAVASTSSESAAYEPLANMNVAAGSLTGRVVQQDETIAEFEVSKHGDFTFRSLDGQSILPLATGSKLDRIRGRLTIQWDAPPGNHQLVVGYERIDYTRGWAALFIILGIIYLVSSLCWLFIDCTEKLEAAT